mgnify:FL=1
MEQPNQAGDLFGATIGLKATFLERLFEELTVLSCTGGILAILELVVHDIPPKELGALADVDGSLMYTQVALR